ncbi:mercuric transport protein periplasmic component [Photobacterium frigidiphilum]|uniref:Periplasmic mercury ion-binding protein n=1 Tax=Photobacterium frigidiphilum TaxID=264736 RepID=A0A2T3J735_9GAMM|nr:mercury resistance system periplasmic binding protein MerP [Photobacterium frigidiphilum]PSU44580.1 mercuric transport protein periplasmic component [Photobacterium frigidiphilum]
MNKLLLITGLFLATFGVIAKPQTVTLEVPTMNCPVCPITVTKSLEKVNGVTDVEVMFEEQQAQVSYDDEITNTKALIDATTNAGYPSYVKE